MVGAEIQKTRPAIVISSDAVGKLPIKLIAPLTSWKEKFSRHIWIVKIAASSTNGLSNDSGVDALQLRGVDTQRFVEKLGNISAGELEEITAAVASVIEYQ